MRQGYTEKPCHGCGSTDIHQKDKLCWACRNMLDWADKEKERTAQYNAENIGIYATTWHCRFSYRRASYSSGSPLSLDKVMQRLLLSLIAERKEGSNSIEPLITKWKDEFWHGSATVYMRKDWAELIRDLNAAIEKELEYAYQEGKRVGNSIVLNLASNELAVNAYNEASRNE